MQFLRAMEALERGASPQARQWMEEFTRGAPETRLTREARLALGRLQKRASGPRRSQ
jgi:hypothetical protein